MTERDKKIEDGIKKLDTEIEALEKAGRPEPNYKTPGIFHGQDIKLMPLELVVALYLELLALQEQYKTASARLGVDFTVGGYNIDDWLADVEGVIAVKKYNIELKKKKKLKEDLKSHFTNDYKEERIVVDLLGQI